MTRRKASIAGFDAELAHVALGDDPIALWCVANLERHVDRHALLAGEDPPDPPYWAHLWSGAVVLARAVPSGARTAIELGCGLGLPGLVAARHGTRVTFVDRIAAPLAFVRASAEANGLQRPACVVADVTSAAIQASFDLVLAAELLYDRPALPNIAATIGRYLAPHGVALVTDARRTDTHAFYAALDALHLRWSVEEHAVREERLPVTVRFVDIRR